jgi:hypothetical protein
MSDDDELVDEDLVDEVVVDEELDEDEELDGDIEELPIDDDEVEAEVVVVVDEEEDEDEDELNPDDVEADLDTILKDRIAAGDDEEDEEDEVDDGSPESGERVAAKGADEFTCPTCFLIVHPRQFGRPGALSCPEGYDPCGAIPLVQKQQKRARKG